ncbi:MAG: nucleoside-diphosphate sugar epimerase [Spirochaetes bacterium GWB1_66_5]|nr:MAG: nucleoside-diphosphate sugar epimerase [Spirochaetes bacterium GWB1_66_5]
MSTLKVLVTGATGQQGGALARLLLQRGHTVRALVRDPQSEKARALAVAGAEPVKGEFNDPASLHKAAAGIDAVFAMSTPFQSGTEAEARQGVAIAEAARKAGVGHLVYNSVSDADAGTGIPHFESKARVERHIRSLDVPFTIVAPVYFFENLRSPFSLPGLKQGALAMSLPENRRLQGIALANIASFDALVLERREEFLGRRVNIASDELAVGQMARALAEASGRKIGYMRTPREQLRAISEDFAKMEEWFEKTGYSADVEGLRRSYPTVGWQRFAEWARAQDWSVLN